MSSYSSALLYSSIITSAFKNYNIRYIHTMTFVENIPSPFWFLTPAPIPPKTIKPKPPSYSICKQSVIINPIYNEECTGTAKTT